MGRAKGLQLPGIEPGSPAWQASIIPLDHSCDAVESKAIVPIGPLGRLGSLRPLFECFYSSVGEHRQGIPFPPLELALVTCFSADSQPSEHSPAAAP